MAKEDRSGTPEQPHATPHSLDVRYKHDLRVFMVEVAYPLVIWGGKETDAECVGAGRAPTKVLLQHHPGG